MMLKKQVYDKLVAQVNKIDISGFVLKTKYDTDKSDLEKKISDADKIILILLDPLKIDYNAKMTVLKKTYISGLATNSAANAIENKIPDVSSLVKKHITIQRLVKLKRKLLIRSMTDILLLQKSISLQQKLK